VKPTIEICVQGVESAIAAQAGGADRVELCEDLKVGGVTPSAGVIAVACKKLTIPVHVLIRPRAGDFCYSDIELDVMRHDVEAAKAMGASGVVLGVLTRDGAVDHEKTSALVAAAKPMSITFHKAFDVCRDPGSALEVLAGLAIDRILTSGQSSSALGGIDLLADLVKAARGRIAILAGGSVQEAQIPVLLAAGLQEIHIGSSVSTGGKTDAGRVRRAVLAAASAHQQQ
jgi:copper homeostasis protein